MPPQLPWTIKRKIIKNYFHGLQRNENSRNVRKSRRGLSSSSINTTIQEFLANVGREGLDIVAEECGVSEEVSELREIAVFKHENDIELPEMLEGAKIASDLKSFEVDPEDFEPFITNVYRAAKSKKLTIPVVIERCAQFEGLEGEFGEFGKIKKEWESFAKDLPKRRDELEDLDEKLKKLKKDHESLLSKYSTDKASLQRYQKNEVLLRKLGFELEQLDNFANFLANVKNNRFDVRKLISEVNSIDDLELKKSNLQRENSDAKESLGNLKTQMKNADKDLAKKTETLSEIRRFKKNRFFN